MASLFAAARRFAKFAERGGAGDSELAAFAESGEPIEFIANGDAAFALDSSPRYPHELVKGEYSVPTRPRALETGEEEIVRIGETLRKRGHL
ncbi:hypothetical protein CFN79_20780 [Chromobacterium vaccinii]|nr:hypothetical protein CFN79_20780 [Chromobacterium vaccinii]